MHAQQLFIRSQNDDGKVQYSPTNLWHCGKCNRLQAELDGGVDIDPAQARAEACCRPMVCEKHGPYQHYCSACWRDERDARTAKRLTEAELVPDDGGWVYVEHLSSHNEGYFSNVVELVEFCEEGDEDGIPIPEFAFCTTSVPFVFDLAGALENECEQDDYHEEIYDQLNGAQELQIAVDAFNEANKANLSYHPDYDRKVRVRPASEDPLANVAELHEQF